MFDLPPSLQKADTSHEHKSPIISMLLLAIDSTWTRLKKMMVDSDYPYLFNNCWTLSFFLPATNTCTHIYVIYIHAHAHICTSMHVCTHTWTILPTRGLQLRVEVFLQLGHPRDIRFPPISLPSSPLYTDLAIQKAEIKF